ncbi:MAG TPA: aconitate hydratase AcnA [Candidatus Acidoferrales bacterium]|nr:aconitate hydratase AcnA [Candidatus Acidoferrales bacterium]
MAATSKNSFSTRSTLRAGSDSYEYFRLEALEKSGAGKVSRLPFSLKVLLENLLRNEDGKFVHADDIRALANWNPSSAASAEKEISFMPARVLLQDFTGVPAVVDLAAMREAMRRLGGDPRKINPLFPAELVIDHSVQVDKFGAANAFAFNADLEMQRNIERYAFLRWGQKSFQNFRVVPPDTGICHQVNLEYLARVVFSAPGEGGARLAFPDSLVGTDSHTTMVNGLGVFGWGVGGIEAEAAMLGQPLSMLIPPVVGFKLHGRLPEGATATDLVLTVTQMLRKKGVVGKFVEYFGTGLSSLTLPDRATIANMAPEYGATMGFFPVDAETLAYLRFTARGEDQVRLVEAYTKEQGLFRTDAIPDPMFSDTLELDLANVVPTMAGPKRPQDSVALSDAKSSFEKTLTAAPKHVSVQNNGDRFDLADGSVVIAAITSCTNTSNPSLMLGAGLLAKKAVGRGLATKPWVKTSFAPGSKVVTDYIQKAGLWPYLEALRFHLVGYGCTTCIGNSGPLSEPIGKAIKDNNLVAVSVLSGNRNFEGRINPLCRANYLASPPLVVAYALAGRMDFDIVREPLGSDKTGKPVFLRDIWPSPQEVEAVVRDSVTNEMFRKEYGDVFSGDDHWRKLPVPEGDLYAWDEKSTYIKHPPYFEQMPKQPGAIADLRGLRALAMLGDSVTTDHISPAGSIPPDSPAGKYLIAHGVQPKDFNSYGARRGNHEVMMRGTFANIRLRNLLAPGTEGGWTTHFPSGEKMSIYDAAMKYAVERVPLLVIAGKEYGSGSSRDWAAKGTILLGIRVVLAESFERIHRSNLVGMGVLPLEFLPGENPKSLGLTGLEIFDVDGLAENFSPRKKVTVHARNDAGKQFAFSAIARVDTPFEVAYYQHGGILQYVLRQMA